MKPRINFMAAAPSAIVGFVRSRDLGVEFVRRSRSAGTRAAEGLADQGDL
jgi:hypothetical protein